MDRPKRQKKSTNYADFYYPTSKRRKNIEKSPQRDKKLQNPPKAANPSPNLTLKPGTAQAQNQKRKRNSSPEPTAVRTRSKSRNQEPILTQTAQVTTPKPKLPEKRSLTEILNELYVNPDYPSGNGSIIYFVY